MHGDAPEISDLIVSYDPETLERRPVLARDVVSRFRELGNPKAVRVVESIPTRGEELDPDAVDALLVRVHAELQRLSEEFSQGPRVRGFLVPLLEAMRAAGAPRPIRVVDVGCGLGFVVRWLAARGELGDDVELVGCDYNAALVRAARRVAEAEELRCRFVVGNAFALAEPGHVFLSTGFIHHFRGPDLVSLFRQQSTPSTWAFVHYDICPTWASPIGAWIFHVARMREPLSHHDGVWSALRAHDDEVLVRAAKEGAPQMRVGCFEGPNRVLPLVRLLRPVVGIRPELEGPLLAALGPARARSFASWT